jgi:HEAT repeat protein
MTVGAGSNGARARALGFVTDVGGVLSAWIVMVALENFVVGLAWRAQFAGSWEMAHARYHLSPIALAVAMPAAVVTVAVARLVAARKERVVAALAFAGAVAVAVGVSGGRRMESLGVRVPFVAVVGVVAAVVAGLAVRRAPLERPRTLAALGAVVAVVAWVADATVLPRLYPAFHSALLVVALAAWASTYLLVRGERSWRFVSLASLALSVLAALLTPRASRAVAGDDNLRRVLVEHAPVLGFAVRVASRIAPPPPIDDEGSEAATTAAVVPPKGASRSLDWSGRDIVVVTIDALRADHVSSYGYHRPTTPNIDRLAARGARFEHAYCPTPHTSYSVTSLMTGKYMRPLLAMGASDDSETWAVYLRRYGFRTAAFYPPAVFFIDEHRFGRMKAEGLGFEYRKEEFAAPELRRAQISDYVASAPKEKPLFLWVHLFEPHEPYVKHPEHVFGGDDSIDAYDSEVATADGVVGEIVELMDARRPGAVFVVSADHGEEFGEHGGRYHGTTVYEEQVRVPLVIVGPGVLPSVVNPPVQTVDLLPTTLAALDVPQPARVRGRDLGALLTGKAKPDEEGLAFAETDDYTLVARGNERLVCVRKIASCTLFDVRADPLELRPVVDRPARVQELRRLTAAIERENGKLETNPLPEALRRCLQGNREAAEDVAALFDDARVDIRREVARCAFRLRAPAMAPQLKRAVAKDEDQDVQRWSAVTLLRLGEGTEKAGELLRDGNPRLRFATALALAEQGDARGEAELVARWEAAFVPGAREPGELDEAREVLAALVRIRARGATPALVRSLEDVRLRPYVAETLGELGDARAAAPLLATFTEERYVDVRPKEARALVRLGARDSLLAPLRRFAGVPEPMVDAVEIARDAGLLVPAHGGWRAALGPEESVDVEVVAPSGPVRLLVAIEGERAGERAPGASSRPVARVDGAPVELTRRAPSSSASAGTALTTAGKGGVAVWTAELVLPARAGSRARVHVEAAGITALWLVPRADEIPPPAAREWQRADGGL